MWKIIQGFINYFSILPSGQDKKTDRSTPLGMASVDLGFTNLFLPLLKKPGCMIVMVFVGMLSLAFCGQDVMANDGFDQYCDGDVYNRMYQQTQNAWTREQTRMRGSFTNPHSYDSLFCGQSMTGGYDRIAQMLVPNGVLSQVMNFTNGIINQACTSTIAPLQQLQTSASRNADLCIPYFGAQAYTKNYLDELLKKLFDKLNRKKNNGYCEGVNFYDIEEEIEIVPVTRGYTLPGFY